MLRPIIYAASNALKSKISCNLLGYYNYQSFYGSSHRFSPDGRTIAVGFTKNEGFTKSDLIELWEPSGKLVEQFEIANIYSTCNISFSPDGKTIALSTIGGTGIIKLQE